jgi:transcriptional regulator
MTAEIHKMPEPKPRLHCTTCHEEGPAPCGCSGSTFITLAEAKTRRKEFAVTLYKRGLTQAQIAEKLHVSQPTIAGDLADFDLSELDKSNQKTTTNPKGSGRRKGTKGKRKAAPTHDRAREVVRPLVEAGEPINREKLAAEHGLTQGAIQRAELAERARLEVMADPVIDPATLSMSMKAKFDAAIRQHKKNLAQRFDQEVSDRVVKWAEETGIKHFVEQYDKIRYMIERRGGVMTSRQYALVLSCLHPDSRKSLSDEKMAEAFRIFAPLKIKLCDNKEVPVHLPEMPATRAAWEARREAVRKQRQAARSASASTSRTMQ